MRQKHEAKPGSAEKTVRPVLTTQGGKSLNNLPPNDVYYGTGQAILEKRQRIKLSRPFSSDAPCTKTQRLRKITNQSQTIS